MPFLQLLVRPAVLDAYAVAGEEVNARASTGDSSTATTRDGDAYAMRTLKEGEGAKLLTISDGPTLRERSVHNAGARTEAYCGRGRTLCSACWFQQRTGSLTSSRVESEEEKATMDNFIIGLYLKTSTNLVLL